MESSYSQHDELGRNARKPSCDMQGNNRKTDDESETRYIPDSYQYSLDESCGIDTYCIDDCSSNGSCFSLDHQNKKNDESKMECYSTSKTRQESIRNQKSPPITKSSSNGSKSIANHNKGYACSEKDHSSSIGILFSEEEKKIK
jgi:hypothetical protein